MTDDIVTRLRKEWAECQTCMTGTEAANEIERLTGKNDILRAQLNLEQQLTELLASERNQWKKLALRAYKLAVGNEWDPTVFHTFEEGLNAYEGANHE